MKNKIVIFDMDGVLFDTIPFARKTFLRRHPGVTNEMYDEIHTGNYHKKAKKYFHLKIKETEAEREKFKIDYAKKKSKTLMFKGMKDLLNNLHNLGFIIVINTNAYERNCLSLLENSGIKKLFDFVASAEVSKDKAKKFKLIEDRYKIKNKDILFITDALGDIKDANIVGVPTIAVTWGVHSRKFFEHKKYNNLVRIVDTIRELEDFIIKEVGLP